jgi:release factor glutamine methyltransferase
MTTIYSAFYRETVGRECDDFVTQSQTGISRDQMPSKETMNRPEPPGVGDAGQTLAIQRHRSPDRPQVFTLFDREWNLLPEVYAPVYAASTRLFTQWLQYPEDGSVLEIGCGAGVTAVMAALSGCRSVVAIDINPAAVENTRLNTVRHDVAGRVRVLNGDMYDALNPAETFDLIFWNSNFVEAPADTVYESDLERAFFDPGYTCHERYLAGARRHLRPQGRLLLGFGNLGNRQRLEEIAKRHCYRTETFTDERHTTAVGKTVTFQLLEFATLHPTVEDVAADPGTWHENPRSWWAGRARPVERLLARLGDLRGRAGFRGLGWSHARRRGHHQAVRDAHT